MEGIKCSIPDENTKKTNHQRTVRKSYKCAFGMNSHIQ